jgi:hypothetical protein
MFEYRDFDDALFFEAIKAVMDLVLIWNEQRPAAA